MSNPMKDAAATMVSVLEPLRAEFEDIKSKLDAVSEKKDEVRTNAINKVKSETDSSNVSSFVESFATQMEREFGTDASAEYVLLAEQLVTWITVINELSNAYLDNLTGTLLENIGSPDSLKEKAREIREKYEGLANSARTLDPEVEIPDLPAISRKGRPKGSGKHQVNASRFEISVDNVKQSGSRLSTILLSHSAKCGGSGTNASLTVAEFFKLLKESYPDYVSEYDGDWDITLSNGKTLQGRRIAE